MNIKIKKHSANRGIIGLLLICLTVLSSYASPPTDEGTYQLFSGYRCDALIKLGGFSKTVTGKATEFSCQKPAIGIALYAGKDLGDNPPEQIAKYFQHELKKHGIKSEVFIKQDHQYGTSMAFYINGDSWLKNAVNPREAINKVDDLAAEAKLVYLTNSQIKDWPKSTE